LSDEFVNSKKYIFTTINIDLNLKEHMYNRMFSLSIIFVKINIFFIYTERHSKHNN